jgi:uncharacterized PurR-regulated membrane protein YhhQ (DUF165 family)
LPWPIVFVTTDLINEYFGERGQKLSLTACLMPTLFVIIYMAMQIPAVAGDGLVSTINLMAFFGQSLWIIVGT